MLIIPILTHTSQVPNFYKLCKNLEAFVQCRILKRLSQVHPIFIYHLIKNVIDTLQ